MGAPIPPYCGAEIEATCLAARAVLGEEDFTATWAEGEALPLEQVIGDALPEDLSLQSEKRSHRL
jgi:hypothetical protein